MPRDPYIREKFTLEPMFLAFGLGPVSEGVEGMAMRIPTLRTIKNAVMTSNIAGSCATFVQSKRFDRADQISRRFSIHK
jgi:hypothetical protein